MVRMEFEDDEKLTTNKLDEQLDALLAKDERDMEVEKTTIQEAYEYLYARVQAEKMSAL